MCIRGHKHGPFAFFRFWTVIFLAAFLLLQCVINSVLMSKPSKVAVYVQVGTQNAQIWEDLCFCISNVARSQTNGVDVFVSTFADDTDNLFIQNMSQCEGVSNIAIQRVQNRGADVGQFLQQIVATDIGNYEAILKIHTKNSEMWRRHMIQNLCGTVDSAKTVVQFFREHREVGVIGPHDLVFMGANATFTTNFCQFIECRPWDVGERKFFHEAELDAMKWAWNAMNGTDLPPGKLWTIIPGTFFWVRGACLSKVNKPWLYKAIPKLLGNMTEGYVTGSYGNAEHAMERWMATIVRRDGNMIADILSAGNEATVHMLG